MRFTQADVNGVQQARYLSVEFNLNMIRVRSRGGGNHSANAAAAEHVKDSV